MQPMVSTYLPTRTWKEYKNPVIFSKAGVQRIELCRGALCVTPPDPSPVDNCVATPQGPSPRMLELFSGPDRCAVDNCDDEGTGDSEDDGDSEDGWPMSRIDLYRLLARPRTDDWIRRKVEEVDTQQRKEKNQMTEWWVRSTQDYSGTMTISEEEAWALVEGTLRLLKALRLSRLLASLGKDFWM